MKQTQNLMKDPDNVKEMEQKMKVAVEDGAKKLEEAKKVAAKMKCTVEEGADKKETSEEENEDDLKVPDINLY